MNSNGQILTNANKLIDEIRNRKGFIKSLSAVKSGLSGGSQQYIIIHAGGDKIEIGTGGPNYSTIIREKYSLVATFIKKGINAEIEQHELIIISLKKQLNDLKFDI